MFWIFTFSWKKKLNQCRGRPQGTRSKISSYDNICMFIVICFLSRTKYCITKKVLNSKHYSNSAVSPDFVSNNGINFKYQSSFQTFLVYAIQSLCWIFSISKHRSKNAMLSDMLAKERWDEGTDSKTSPVLSPACMPQAAQYLGRLSPFRGTADLSALTSVIFTENPPSPNRQRGHLWSGWQKSLKQVSFAVLREMRLLHILQAVSEGCKGPKIIFDVW